VHLFFGHIETEKEYIFLTEIPETKFQLRTVREKGKTVVIGDNNSQINSALKRLNRNLFKKYGNEQQLKKYFQNLNIDKKKKIQGLEKYPQVQSKIFVN